MPEPANTLLIEGSFEELTEELAQYLDHLKKPPSQDGNTVQAEVVRLLGDNQKDEALKKLVTASVSLNSAPERGVYVDCVHARLDRFYLFTCESRAV